MPFSCHNEILIIRPYVIYIHSVLFFGALWYISTLMPIIKFCIKLINVWLCVKWYKQFNLKKKLIFDLHSQQNWWFEKKTFLFRLLNGFAKIQVFEIRYWTRSLTTSTENEDTSDDGFLKWSKCRKLLLLVRMRNS